jgi:hypothetical protein
MNRISRLHDDHLVYDLGTVQDALHDPAQFIWGLAGFPQDEKAVSQAETCRKIETN